MENIHDHLAKSSANKSYINLNEILEIQNYYDSLSKWIRNFHLHSI